ncbi:MAG: CotH kinase family protein, partial [Bacteroidaceae bacterium]|nr:CotH kinase family protein [Bacteroidaceae bacterium]
MRKYLLLLLALLCEYGYAYDSRVDEKILGKVISSPGNDPQRAFDSDPDTYFQANGDEMKWVGLELDTTYVVTRIAFRPMNSSQGEDNMLLSVFEGANRPDFMDAVPLYLIGEKPSRYGMTTIDVNVTRAFRYLRYVGSSGSYCRVAELEFYGHAGEGKDSLFYQVTDIPTVSIHVQDEISPQSKGVDYEAYITNIYEKGTLIQEYPILTRVRGNYSSTHPNKPYRVKFNDDKKHHMLKDGNNESPVKAKKWVLVNSYRDKTLLRNPIAYNISKRVGPTFTPWSQQVDLILNGDYHGTYTLCDHVSVHSGRIDITEMDETDVEGENLTGGYFFEADNNYGGEKFHWLSAYGNTMSMHSPEDDVAQAVQFNYLKDYFGKFEDRLFGASYRDSTKGYRSMLDLESFLKYFLISEFNGNTDMICQVFLYKERGDNLIYSGPVWDHELALENDETV